MTREEIIRLAQEAGLTIHDGDQQRILWDGDIVEILRKLIELSRSAS